MDISPVHQVCPQNHLARHSERGKKTRQTERKKKRWEDNIKEWTGLEFAKSRRVVENRRKKMEETGCEVISGAPTTPAVKGEVKVKKEIPAQHNTLSDGDLKVCLSYNKA